MKKIINKKTLAIYVAAATFFVLPLSASAVDKLVVKDTGGTPKFVVTDTGNVGIGSPTTPTIPLQIYTEDVAPYVDILGLNPAAGTSADIQTGTGIPPAGPIQAVNNEFLIRYKPGVPITNGFNTFRMIARTDATVSDNLTGTINAANLFVQHYGTGTLSYATGISGNLLNKNTGSITYATTIKVASPVNDAGGTITNAFGIQILAQKVTGVSKAYGVYQAGASDINYFAGNIGIGTTTPGSKLSVVGLPTAPPDASGNRGMVCITNSGNMWVDDDGVYDCN